MPCPEGFNCPSRHNYAIPQRPGYWSPWGTHISLVVPAGWQSIIVAGSQQTSFPTVTEESSIGACTPGTYSLSNSGSCTTCPAGTVCPQTSNVPLACNEGFESRGEAPNDVYGNFACHQCGLNMYFDATTKLCTAIPVGSGTLHPMFALDKCWAGMYSDATSISTSGIRDCQPCPEG